MNGHELEKTCSRNNHCSRHACPNVCAAKRRRTARRIFGAVSNDGWSVGDFRAAVREAEIKPSAGVRIHLGAPLSIGLRVQLGVVVHPPSRDRGCSDGPQLRESGSSHDDSALRVIQVENGRIMGREVPIATLARILSDQLGRPVLDSTKLSSHYDVTLQWPTDPESSEPTILNAIQEQLGLKLVPQLMPKEFLVIDQVEMPSAD